MSVGSQEGPGDDGEYDYEHLRNISDNKLIPFTYEYVYEFFEGSKEEMMVRVSLLHLKLV